MNIIGEGFPEEIIKQVKQRQKVYGSGYIGNRNPEEIVYLNANTSWVKLVSSVDIENNKILQDESLRGVVNKGSSLAEQFVLFNGTNQNPQNQRSGIATNGDLLGNNNAYGIGGTEFGLRPMMGIQSAEIKHENRGSIRRATVKIKAHNKTQFDIIDILYLRLGFNVLLEWGHSMYYNNKGELQKNAQINNSLANKFLSPKKEGPYLNPILTYGDFLDLIQKQRLISQGNYDAMFAKVCNFHWSFLPDGSYDITLDLVSIGDVVESFKINVLVNGINSPPVVSTNTDEPSPSEIIDSYANQNSIGQYFYRLKSGIISTPEYIVEENKESLKKADNSRSGVDNSKK
jgi:hypothetical protein